MPVPTDGERPIERHYVPATGGKPGRPVVLEDAAKWDEFISLVLSGMGGYQAIEHMGHSWKTLNRFLNQPGNERYKEEFLEAKAVAVERPAMRVLLDVMENDEAKDSDRISAADKAITHSRRELQEIRGESKPTLIIAEAATIERLAAIADERLDKGDVIDVEWEDDD